jgi:tetratricopeptide (TPR) repeat protein
VAYYARGRARLLLKDYREAILDCDEALRLAGDDCGVYVTRGNARYHLADAGGVLDYRKAFALNPDLAARGLVALLDLQLLYNSSGVLAECTEHLRRNPGDVLSYARRGLALMLLGKSAEAQRDFHQFRLRNPKGRQNLERLIAAAKQRRRR